MAERTRYEEQVVAAYRDRLAARETLDTILKAVEKTCVDHGWSFRRWSADEDRWRHATVSVSRPTLTAFGSVTATGMFKVTLDGGVDVLLQQSSSSVGLEELHSAILTDLQSFGLRKPKPKDTHMQKAPAADSFVLEKLLRRFHAVARQLRKRRENRSTLCIEDEYDAQDLLHSLLRGYFDDVRAEEATPSYAGGGSRLDFLLKAEQTAVEIKLASPRLTDGKIGEQLIVDIQRYQAHPACHRLVCLVYDPESHVNNPSGLENDLSGRHGSLDVRVYVVPQ